VFCVLLWQVAGHGPVTGWDRAVRRHVQSAAHSTSWHWLTPWAHHLADLGNVAQAVPVLAVAAAFAAWRLRSWRPALLAAGAYAALLVLVVPLKVIVARPGPGSTSLHQELGYFPSGHTADAVLCLGTAALLLAACCPPRLAWLVRAAGALVVLLVGAALIWCDYHWLADVLGSLTLCGALLLLAPWPDRGAGDRAHPSSNTAGEPVPDR
jgi:membrane-associated phospholipid phosphatase